MKASVLFSEMSGVKWNCGIRREFESLAQNGENTELQLKNVELSRSLAMN